MVTVWSKKSPLTVHWCGLFLALAVTELHAAWCGGDFTDEMGTLSIENYPPDINHNLVCNWTITISFGVVSLNITNMPECDTFSSYRIFDGFTQMPLSGNLCGTSLQYPTIINGVSNSVQIVVRIHMSRIRHRWRISWGVPQCAGTLLTDDTGTLNYLDYQQGLYLGLNCTWNITIPSGVMFLNIADFRTSCSEDNYFQVFDGITQTPLRDPQCGNSQHFVVMIKGVSNSVRIEFRTDRKPNMRGWRATWGALCGSGNTLLTDDTGTLTSPGYPLSYSYGLDCSWNITISPGVVSVKIKFPLTGCDAATHFQIFDGFTERALTNSLCGDSSGEKVINGVSNSVRIEVRSDEGRTSDSWSITWGDVCGTPPQVEDSYLNPVVVGSGYGKVASYTCSFGYKIMNVSHQIVCLKKGKWSPAPVCSVVDCGQPPEEINGATIIGTVNSTTVNATVPYDCSGAGTTNFTTFIGCSESGNWSTPVCKTAVVTAPPLENMTNDDQLYLYIGIGSSLFLLLVVALVIVVVKLRNYRSRSQTFIEMPASQEILPNPVNDNEDHEQETSFGNKLNPDIQEKMNSFKIPEDKLKLGVQLGKGCFGSVYKGQLTTSTGALQTVAVKSLKDDRVMDFDSFEKFIAEGTLMIDFKHTNVLSLIGIVHEEGDRPLIVLPFMENGDLHTFISKDDQELTLGDIVHLAYQISNGMNYLARERFVHRDLAARNCMIDESYIVKIADFGLSRDVYERDYYVMNDRNKPLPMRWMAVESLLEGRYTSKSDVWSYGVTMWELLTRGAIPYPGLLNSTIKQYVMNGQRLDRPKICPPCIYDIMFKCWMEEPDERPTFIYISNFLFTLLHDNAKSPATVKDDGDSGYSYTRNTTRNISDDYIVVT